MHILFSHLHEQRPPTKLLTNPFSPRIPESTALEAESRATPACATKGIDYYGNDVGFLRVLPNDPAQCQKACALVPKCKYWAFVTRGWSVFFPTGSCFLKSAAANQKNHSNRIVGPKNCA